jgi:hypothetical protein
VAGTRQRDELELYDERAKGDTMSIIRSTMQQVEPHDSGGEDDMGVWLRGPNRSPNERSEEARDDGEEGARWRWWRGLGWRQGPGET